MKITYKQAREILKKECSSVRYFNKHFWNAFLDAMKTRKSNIENNIDDSYYNGLVLLFHAYDSIYKSDFYNKNSSAYCEFLSAICGNEMIKA